jgi:CxxC motif-containing protein (DUF1111 family)
VSALAVIGAGVLWCHAGPRPRQAIAAASPAITPTQPALPPSPDPDKVIRLQVLDLPADQPAPPRPVVQTDTSAPPTTVDPVPNAEPVVAAPAAAQLLTAATPAEVSTPTPPAGLTLAAQPATPTATPAADRIAEGRNLFLHNWQVNDPLAHGDGIGPLFNAQSCAECHQLGGLGGAGENRHNVCIFLVAPGKGDPVVEGAIHQYSVQNFWPESLDEAAAKLQHINLPLGTKPPTKPTIYPGQLIAAMVSTPSLWGMGVIDQISDDDIRSLPSGYGIGRTRTLSDGHVGKFGWKGQFGSLQDFVANACAGELGLSNSAKRQLEPYAYHESSQAPHDLTDAQVQSLTDFVAQLPRPQEVAPKLPDQQLNVARGKQIFYEIGCAGCHVPDVGSAKGVYSDFRLHDVVDAQSRYSEPYYANAHSVTWPREYPKPVEWKTTPLWGLADTAPYWHDGTARTIPDAILKHSGEAENTVRAFENLGPKDQGALLNFLETMKAPANNPNPPPEQPKRPLPAKPLPKKA